jgi:hypothetical protein
MIVSQSLYCSEFVHRARCFPVGSPRTARRIGRMRARAQRRKHMWARSRGRGRSDEDGRRWDAAPAGGITDHALNTVEWSRAHNT